MGLNKRPKTVMLYSTFLGNPLNSAIWLVNILSKKGEPMLKGQFISTGTCTTALTLEKNTQIKADFGILGCVEFDYI